MARLTSTGLVGANRAKAVGLGKPRPAGFGRIRRWFAIFDGVKYTVRPASTGAGQRPGKATHAWREMSDNGPVTQYLDIPTGAKTLLIIRQPGGETNRLLFAGQWAAMLHAEALAGVAPLPWKPSRGRGRQGATIKKVRSSNAGGR